MLVFLLQFFMMVTILRSIFFGPWSNGDFLEEQDAEDFPFSILVAKFFCTIVLHISTQPKLCEALERLRYIKNHPYKFERITIPIGINFMKLFIEMMLEVTSLFITAV